ncbi:MAG: ATP-dependent DNA ligase [Actinomycetota bacterium]
MTLPFGPPVPPMLAKLEREIPRGDGWLYEPKWDGFRAIVFRDGDRVHIQSRDSRPLERYFPELAPALRDALPAGCVVDGEVIVAGPEGLDFDSLQLRIHPAESRVRKLSAEIPASFVAFDLLAEGGEDLRSRPLAERRTRLVEALGLKATERLPSGRTTVLLTPQTDDADEAEGWFERLERIGLDGVIAKRADQPYIPGQRVMVKVKHRRTAECVVGGYRLAKSGDGVGSLLLGLYDDGGVLHYVGHTSAFNTRERRAVLEELRPLEGGESFGPGRTPGGPSRWTGGRDPAYVSIEPRLVCEVTYDHLQGERFRHATGFVRWRPDRRPRDCTFDQLGPPVDPAFRSPG